MPCLSKFVYNVDDVDNKGDGGSDYPVGLGF